MLVRLLPWRPTIDSARHSSPKVVGLHDFIIAVAIDEYIRNTVVVAAGILPYLIHCRTIHGGHTVGTD